MQETIMSKHNCQNIETFNDLRPISRTDESVNANVPERYKAAYDGNRALVNTNEVRECYVRLTRLDPRIARRAGDKYAKCGEQHLSSEKLIPCCGKMGELQNVNIVGTLIKSTHVVDDDIIVNDDESNNCSEESGEHGDAIFNALNSSDGLNCKDNGQNDKKPDNCSDDNDEIGHAIFRVLNILDDFDCNDDKIKTEQNDDSISEKIATSNSCSEEAPHVMAATIPSHASVGNQAVSAAPTQETCQQTANHMSTFEPREPAASKEPHVETTRQQSHSQPCGRISKTSRTSSSSFTQSPAKQQPKTNNQDNQQTTQQLNINPVIQTLTQLVESVSTNPFNPHQIVQRLTTPTRAPTQTTTTKSASNTRIETPMQRDVTPISTNQPVQSGKEQSINQPMRIPKTRDHPMVRRLHSTAVPTSVLHQNLIRLREALANKQGQQQTQQTCPLSGPDSRYDGSRHMAHDVHQMVEAREPSPEASDQTDCKKWIMMAKDHSHENSSADVESEPCSGNCSDASSPFPTFLPIRNISVRECPENQNSTVEDDDDNSNNCRIEKDGANQGSNKMLEAVSIKKCEVRLVRLDPRKVHCKIVVDDKAIGGSDNESDFYGDASQSSCDNNSIFDPFGDNSEDDGDVQTKKVSDSGQRLGRGDKGSQKRGSSLTGDKRDPPSMLQMMVNRQEKVVQTEFNTKEEKDVKSRFEIHTDSQTERKANTDRETQVVIKTDNYDDKERKEKKGARKSPLKDSSNKHGKDRDTKRRRATKDISYIEVCGSDSEGEHDSAWLPDGEDEAPNNSEEVEITQSDDDSNQSRLSQDGQTSKMLQIQAAKMKIKYNSPSLEYHAVHPGFRFDPDQRRFAERLKQTLPAVTVAPAVCGVCGCAFASDDRFSHHLKLQKQVLETHDYQRLQHPQVVFHFIQQNGKQVTSPLVSINQNILGMANGTTSCDKDKPCRTTQKEQEPAGEPSEPLADCADGAEADFSCLLCSATVCSLQEAVGHIGRCHLSHSEYVYCTAGCGAVLMDPDSHVRHLRAYHSDTNSQAQVSNSQRDGSVSGKSAPATNQEGDTSGERITAVNGDSVSEDTSKNSYRRSEHNALSWNDTVSELAGCAAGQGSVSQRSTHHSRANGFEKTDSSLLTGLHCTDCGGGPAFTTLLALCEHRWSAHQSEAYPCPVCGQQFSQFLGTHLLKAHAEYLPSPTQQYDNNCVYDTIPKAYQTMLTHSKCSLCDDVKERLKVFTFHSTRHLCRTLERTDLLTGKKRLECMVCDVSFASFFRQRVHMATHHVELHCSATQILAQVAIWLPVPSTCPICQKNVKRDLKKHMYYHKKPVQCPKCNKSMLVESLRTHLKTQHGKCELTHTCEICGKMFSSEYNLKKHQNRMHLSQEYQCPECKKTLKNKYTLHEHIRRTHQGIKQYEKKQTYNCAVCDWKCTTTSTKIKHTLKEHMTVHTGEKLYTCPVCKKQFNRNSAFGRHKRLHLEESPRYRCEEAGCGRTFTQTCSLQRHMLTHTQEAPYLCQWCGKSFKQSYPLKQHVAKHHPQNLEEYLLQDPLRAVVRKNSERKTQTVPGSASSS